MTRTKNYSLPGPKLLRATLICVVLALLSLLLPLACQAQTNAPAEPAPVIDVGSIFTTNVVSITNVLEYTTNNPPSLQGSLAWIWGALNSTNAYWTPYAVYAGGLPKKYGAGIGWFMEITPHVVTGVRVDYVNGAFWMPSVSGTLQEPLDIGPVHLKLFALAGVGLPLSGARFQLGNLGGFTVPGNIVDNDGKPTAIGGIGVAVHLFKQNKFDANLVGSVERWSGFDGQQVRVGVALRF